MCNDSQEVGLEAAILERVRNSSMAKYFYSENVEGLKNSNRSGGFKSKNFSMVAERFSL